MRTGPSCTAPPCLKMLPIGPCRSVIYCTSGRSYSGVLALSPITLRLLFISQCRLPGPLYKFDDFRNNACLALFAAIRSYSCLKSLTCCLLCGFTVVRVLNMLFFPRRTVGAATKPFRRMRQLVSVICLNAHLYQTFSIG